MTKTPKTVTAPQFLSGWKEIANYLGKGVRTVQRYERELALPIRRPAGRSTGSVVATRAELDAWVSASPIREAFRLATPVQFSQPEAANIRNGIEEMRKLRDQMMELRIELRRSVHSIEQSISGLHSELRNRTWEVSDDHLKVLDSQSRTAEIIELLKIDPRRRNAS